MKPIVTALILALAVLFSQADVSSAKGGHLSGGRSSGSKSSTSHAASSSKSKSTVHSSSETHKGVRKKAEGVKRDNHGKIDRSSKAKDGFRRKHPCPSTGKTSGACPGYVIDHIKPLKKGGADNPSNMQWQTKADAKVKDKWE